jgi:peptidoglycan hydrolase CwlO-like protein
MNRSVLVIVCDFLLISLLSLASFEKTSRDDARTGNATGVEVQAVQDMLDVLKQALAQEQEQRTALSQQLGSTRQALEQTQAEVAQRQREMQQVEQKLRATEAQAQALAAERAALQQQQAEAQQRLTALQQQHAAAQASIEQLQTRLQASDTVAALSQAKADALQAELAARREEARKMQEEIERLQQAKAQADLDRSLLASNLARVQTEATQLKDRLEDNRQLVVALNQEKQQLQAHATQLAKGVDTLAESSQAIVAEIRDARQYTANHVYNAYLSNRLDVLFDGKRTGILGIGLKGSERGSTVAFEDGGRAYAVFHLAETLLPTWIGGPAWEELTAWVVHQNVGAPLSELRLAAVDPRVVLAPLDAATLQRLRVQPFPVTQDPAKFQQAVLVGQREGYYGEVEFRLVPGLPGYLRMETRPIGKIFGKFSPSKGDLAFSKSGELLGIMVNSEYCALLQNLRPGQTVRLGTAIAQQDTKLLGADINRRLQSLPLKLQ